MYLIQSQTKDIYRLISQVINMELLPIIFKHYPANRYWETPTYQVEVVLIYQQILITDLQENVQQLEGRINNQMLGVKGLS